MAGNQIWRNTGAEPLISFSFMLRVEGMWDLPCKRITNMRREHEFDYIQEGGLNDYVHAKRKAISKPFTFQVERYVGVDTAVASDPLALGTELTLPLILFVNKYGIWDVGDMTPVRTYAFTGCTVIAKDYGELNAEQSSLLLETTTISYRELVCVDIYSELVELDTWQFDGTKKGGAGPRHYNQAETNIKEASKAELAGKAKKWEFDKKEKDGAGTRSAKYHKKEASKAQLAGKAKKWKFDKTTKDGAEENGALEENGAAGENAAAEKNSVGTRSAKYHEKEASKAELAGKAKKWKFDKKEKDGAGTRSAKYHKKEDSKAELAGKAKKWKFDKTTKDGAEENGAVEKNGAAEENAAAEKNSVGTRSAKYHEKEDSKAQLAGKAKKWKFDKKEKDGAGTRSAKYHEEEASESTLAGKAKEWQFDSTKKEGKGTRSAKYHGKEADGASLDTKAKEWQFDSKKKEGKGTRSARYNEKEADGASLDTKAKEWQFDSAKKQGNGTRSANYDKEETDKAAMEAAAKLWPETSSVKKPENKVPEPRLWPKDKSAQSITQYLYDYRK